MLTGIITLFLGPRIMWGFFLYSSLYLLNFSSFKEHGHVGQWPGWRGRDYAKIYREGQNNFSLPTARPQQSGSTRRNKTIQG